MSDTSFPSDQDPRTENPADIEGVPTFSGHDVLDDQNQYVGKVTDVIYEEAAGEVPTAPTWLVVDPGVLRTAHYVPAAGAVPDRRGSNRRALGQGVDQVSHQGDSRPRPHRGSSATSCARTTRWADRSAAINGSPPSPPARTVGTAAAHARRAGHQIYRGVGLEQPFASVCRTPPDRSTWARRNGPAWPDRHPPARGQVRARAWPASSGRGEAHRGVSPRCRSWPTSRRRRGRRTPGWARRPPSGGGDGRRPAPAALERGDRLVAGAVEGGDLCGIDGGRDRRRRSPPAPDGTHL